LAKPPTDNSAAILSAIVDSSDDAIVSKTLEGTITSWNRAAEQMFGYPASEALGRHISLIIPPERLAEEDFVSGQIRQGLKVEPFETVRVTKDGRRLDISLTVSPVRNESGELIGASKIARDITEKKRLEREREDLLAREQAARQQLTEALSARDEFIAVASHELRNPLNTAYLTIGVLRKLAADPDALPQVRQNLEKAKAQLDRYTVLLDRLFDVSLLRSGTFELYREPFDLSSLIREIASRHITLNPLISLQLAPAIRGTWDRTRLDQAITNLLSNACKYGMGKPILVSASSESSEATVCVRDEGEGIAAENLCRLFGRFERILPDPRPKGWGSGFG